MVVESADALLDQLTASYMALPEAAMEQTGQHTRYLVRGNTFAYFLNDHHGDGRIAVCLKAGPGENQERAASDPGASLSPLPSVREAGSGCVSTAALWTGTSSPRSRAAAVA